jgi:hypothetical protein
LKSSTVSTETDGATLSLVHNPFTISPGAAEFTKCSQNISYYDIFMWYNIYSKREEDEPMSGTILLILALMAMLMAAGHH